MHADIPHQEVIFLEETDPISSPMKAKGVGELGICGVGAAVANADLQRHRRARARLSDHSRQADRTTASSDINFWNFSGARSRLPIPFEEALRQEKGPQRIRKRSWLRLTRATASHYESSLLWDKQPISS